MACCELRLPAGVSVLHVEQEVTGDNTLAVDSVLECDTERVQLLAREGELLYGLRGQGHSSRQVCVPGVGGVCFKYSKTNVTKLVFSYNIRVTSV